MHTFIVHDLWYCFFVQQVVSLQAELSYLQGHLATIELPQQPSPSPPQTTIAPQVVSLANLPSATSSAMPTTYDLSSLFDPIVQTSSWAMNQRPIDPRQYLGSGPSATSPSGGNGGDLQTLARELLHRYGSSHVACSNAPSSHSLSKWPTLDLIN